MVPGTGPRAVGSCELLMLVVPKAGCCACCTTKEAAAELEAGLVAVGGGPCPGDMAHPPVLICWGLAWATMVWCMAVLVLSVE